jgi:hypothetical protein
MIKVGRLYKAKQDVFMGPTQKWVKNDEVVLVVGVTYLDKSYTDGHVQAVCPDGQTTKPMPFVMEYWAKCFELVEVG